MAREMYFYGLFKMAAKQILIIFYISISLENAFIKAKFKSRQSNKHVCEDIKRHSINKILDATLYNWIR